MIELNSTPTGWFHIGWSDQIPVGGVLPMRYFGQDLVAFRTEDGDLAVLDAHCRHLGAHLGYETSVSGRCVVCRYHGWEWDDTGANTRIPYQDRPVRARLKAWPTIERHGLMFMWHDRHDGPPREGWEPIDVFADLPGGPVDPDDFHPCYPHVVVDRPDEPVHVQLVQENLADSVHFRYTHGTPGGVELLDFETMGPRWRSSFGFLSPKTGKVAVETSTVLCGVGLAFSGPADPNARRLVLTATPVDEHRSHIRVSYFMPRLEGSRDELTESQRDFAELAQELYEQDARIWRHQVFVQKPVFARQDVAAYTNLRAWSSGFYEGGTGPGPTPVVIGIPDDEL